jgi:hypothetical protein
MRTILTFMGVASIGLAGCVTGEVSSALKPVDGQGWHVISRFGHINAGFFNADVDVGASPFIWNAVSGGGPLLPIIPMPNNDNSTALSYSVSSKNLTHIFDGKKTELVCSKSGEKELAQTEISEDRHDSPHGRILYVSLRPRQDLTQMDQCTLRFVGLVDGGKVPIPDLTFVRDTLIDVDPVL